MFYKLNRLTGRLAGSQQLKALLPQGLRPYVEPQQIIYDPGFKAAQVPVQELAKNVGSIVYGEVPAALRQKMIQFQKDDGVPVHLKGGTSDYILFGTTVLLIAVGLVETFRYFYISSFPKKQ